MKLLTEKVKVIARGNWDADNPQYGEWVGVVPLTGGDGERMRKYSLDKELNGSISVGDEGVLQLVSTMRAEAHQRGDGSLGVHYREKFKVVGLEAGAALPKAA